MFLTVMYIVGFSYSFNNLNQRPPNISLYLGVKGVVSLCAVALEEAADTRLQPSPLEWQRCGPRSGWKVTGVRR